MTHPDADSRWSRDIQIQLRLLWARMLEVDRRGEPVKARRAALDAQRQALEAEWDSLAASKPPPTAPESEGQAWNSRRADLIARSDALNRQIDDNNAQIDAVRAAYKQLEDEARALVARGEAQVAKSLGQLPPGSIPQQNLGGTGTYQRQGGDRKAGWGDYQERVTGVPRGFGYKLPGTDRHGGDKVADGYRDGYVQECKMYDPYAKFYTLPKIGSSALGKDLDQMEDSARICFANGMGYQVHTNSLSFSKFFREELAMRNVRGVQVFYTP